MKKASSIFIFLIVLLVFESCAKKGTPEGGPVDIEPPRFVRASPENFSTNFDAEEIRIFFDEYIMLEEAQRQIIISPPMDPRPEITPLGTASRSIRIGINDTLQPNTTYTINFGRSIVDNNEANPLDFFQYVFSTGSHLDSLSISGTVSDAYLLEPDPYVSVMLYEVDSAYTDSVVYNETPRYITNTLDSTLFQLDYLKEGTFRMVAILDQNNNYQFDPKTEKIAFLEDFVTTPTDSIYNLNLFREITPFSVTRPQQVAQQQIIFGYTGKLDLDSLRISMLEPAVEDLESRITKAPDTDTLNYWYKPLIEEDSLRFLVEGPGFQDSLISRRREMDRDSLRLSFDPSGSLTFNQHVNILPTIPLEEVTNSLITLVDNDTVAVPFTTRYEEFENRIVLEFEKEENQVYNFQALPGAFTGFFGSTHDTVNTTFRTRSFSDYGTIIVNLQNVEQYPIIVQLTNQQGEIQAERHSSTESNFTFPFLNPGQYLLRVIYDRNGNGIWDTGNFLEKQQPEEIIYYPETLDVRPNWDETYLISL